jgi:hypothetical protein
VRVDFSHVFDQPRFSYRIKIDPSSGSLSVEAIARRRRAKVRGTRFSKWPFSQFVWQIRLNSKKPPATGAARARARRSRQRALLRSDIAQHSAPATMQALVDYAFDLWSWPEQE